MDVEEIKKIIQDKIEADEAASEVRKSIKSYIHQKQDAREGFTETFKPLIETSEKVKESVDNQQNKLIKQLQENQLALTQGFESNRKAITSGFDKMDEVKKWDLGQLPGYEAIEEADEEYESLGISEKIKILNARIKKNYNTLGELNDLENKAVEEGNEDEEKYYIKKYEEVLRENKELEKERKILQKILEKESGESVEKPKITTLEYKKDEMDKFLNNKESIDLLNFYGLKLPSKYKDSMDELQKAFEKGMQETANLKKDIKHVAEYKKDTITGLILAFPIKGQQAKEKTKELIKEYNIMQIFINNMGQLRNYKKITGTGIMHFNNPQQLVDRLKLLAGSIIAGNSGVKQEFSQIAHLLHQLKVITKKTLNDLLKKIYIVKINNGKSYSHFFNQKRKNW